jgi:hypothetical protein
VENLMAGNSILRQPGLVDNHLHAAAGVS